MSKTKIEWTDEAWNPVTGCTKVSSGCEHCYAERMSKRLRGRCGYPADDPFAVTLHPDRLDQPLRWRKPRRVFVCSMGDLFHEDVPDEFIAEVWNIMRRCDQHIFQVLTKRPQRMADVVSRLRFDNRGAGRVWLAEHPNDHEGGWSLGVGHLGCSGLPWIWPGTSVEDQPAAIERLPHLFECPAAVRFVSCEPMLSHIDLTPWFGASYDPMYGGEQTSGRSSLSGDPCRSYPNRRGGVRLEEIQKGRERHGKISPGPGNEKRDSIPRAGPPPDLAPSLWSNTREPTDKPQRRQRKEQPPEQSRTRHAVSERETLDTCAGKRNNPQSTGRAEPNEQAHDTPGSSDPTPPTGRAPTGRHSEGLQDCLPNGVEDRSRGQVVGISWCICGGESGPGARPCDIRWIRSIVQQCRAAEVPCFVKQLGAKPFGHSVHEIPGYPQSWPHDPKGGNPDEWPADLWVREFPR